MTKSGQAVVAGRTTWESASVRTLERWQVLVLAFLTDVLILWVGLNVATLTRLHTLIYVDNLWLLQRDRVICLGLFALIAVFAGAYNSARLNDGFDSIYYAWMALAATGIVALALTALLPREVRVLSRREIVVGCALAGILTAIWRYHAAAIVSRFSSFSRFFCVLGSESQAKRIAEEISTRPNVRADAQYITLEDFREKVERAWSRQDKPSYVAADSIIALTSQNRDELTAMLEFCEQNCQRTFLYPCMHDTLFFQQRNLLAIAGIPLLEVSNRVTLTPYVYVKRLIDLSAAAVSLLLVSPVCIVTALAIKLTTAGGIFYRQERMGKGGRIFKLYKFRSMVADAETDTGPVWAEANDARVTTVGRFIRKHRIDEIPQLLNVLKGDMSLVGPRPERPHFHQEFCDKWPLFERRLRVRPGLTSLSHVMGSYDSEPYDRLRYDLVYISNLSFLTDLKVIAATVRVVLGAKGAQ